MRRRVAALLSGLALLCVTWGCESAAPPPQTSSSSGSSNSEASAPSDHGSASAEGNPHAAAESGSSSGAGADAVESLNTAGGELDLDEIRFTAPEGWGRKGAGNAFVAAEFTLPKGEEGAEDGRLTVSFAGGSVEANAERWRGQFGGKPSAESVNELEVDGIKVTLLDFSGEFDDSRGPFARGAKKAGYRMMGAMIPIEEGRMCFVKATGPAATIAANAEKIVAFIHSAKRGGAEKK